MSKVVKYRKKGDTRLFIYLNLDKPLTPVKGFSFMTGFLTNMLSYIECSVPLGRTDLLWVTIVAIAAIFHDIGDTEKALRAFGRTEFGFCVLKGGKQIFCNIVPVYVLDSLAEIPNVEENFTLREIGKILNVQIFEILDRMETDKKYPSVYSQKILNMVVEENASLSKHNWSIEEQHLMLPVLTQSEPLRVKYPEVSEMLRLDLAKILEKKEQVKNPTLSLKQFGDKLDKISLEVKELNFNIKNLEVKIDKIITKLVI